MAIQAWWFAAGDTLPHGDGRKIVIGETHKTSRHPFDAQSLHEAALDH